MPRKVYWTKVAGNVHAKKWMDDAIQFYADDGKANIANGDSAVVDRADKSIRLTIKEREFYKLALFRVTLRPFTDDDGFPALLVCSVKRVP